MVPHHGGGDMLAQVWSWSENLSTYFTDEIFVVNHLYLLRVTQFSNIRQNEATNNDFHLKHKWQMQMLCNISEEFEGPHGHDTLEKCFLHVNYALKHFLVNTPWRCSWKLTLGIRPCFWRKCYQMQMLCKSFIMSEEFEGPRGHYLLEKGFLNVKYVLNCFLVDTTWRCTWKPMLSEGLANTDIEEIVTNIASKPQSWRYISFSTAERRVQSVTPHKRKAHGHVNNVLRWVYI